MPLQISLSLELPSVGTIPQEYVEPEFSELTYVNGTDRITYADGTSFIQYVEQ